LVVFDPQYKRKKFLSVIIDKDLFIDAFWFLFLV